MSNLTGGAYEFFPGTLRRKMKPILKKKVSDRKEYSLLVEFANQKEEATLFFLRVTTQAEGDTFGGDISYPLGITCFFPNGNNALCPYKEVFFPYKWGELQKVSGLDWFVQENRCYAFFTLDELINKLIKRGRSTNGINQPPSQEELGDRKVPQE